MRVIDVSPHLFKGAVLGIMVALLLLLGSPAPAAHAWSWSSNAYSNGTGSNPYCGGSTSYPCVLWQQPDSTSVTLYAYLSGLGGFQGYDFSTPTVAGMNSWNGVPAWNPYLLPCYLPYCGPVEVTGGWLPCHNLGLTSVWAGPEFFYNNLWHGYINPAVSPDGYGAVVTLNNDATTVRFNNTMTVHAGTCTSSNPDLNDGGSTITHELGHVLGLGHSYYTSALMYPSNTCLCRTPQWDDIAGMHGIYPGYLP